MKRSTFVKQSLLASAAWVVGANRAYSQAKPTQVRPFKLKFSPEFGMFNAASGKDIYDQIRWGKDQGFRAWENTWLLQRPVEEQEKISQLLQKLGMEFGQFVGSMSFKAVTYAGRDEAAREQVLKDVKASVEVAKRMNTRFIHNVLGLADPRLQWDFQLANAIELLKRVADIYEPHGITMVMETMNHKINHAGMFLHTIPQAYALAKAIDRPSIKMLFDAYHVQIQEGNIIPSIDYAWDQIAYFQIGDTPGRFEPTTGEMNYKNILQHVYNKGYRGFLGMEHSIKNPGKEGVLAAVEAYRSIDAQ